MAILSSAELSLKIYTHIDDIGPDVWNSLAGDKSLYMTYEWFKLNETDHSLAQACFYLLLYHCKHPLALLPCFLVTDPATYAFYNARTLLLKNELNPDVLLDPDDRQKYCTAQQFLSDFDFYPHLYIASPCGYISDLIYQQTFDPKSTGLVIDMLLHGVEQIAAQTGAVVTAFLYVPPDNVLFQALSHRDFVCTLLFTECVLDLDYDSFEDYLLHLGLNARKSIRRELRSLQTEGTSIERDDDLMPYVQLMAELSCNLQHKYGHDLEDLENEIQWFVRVAELFKGKAWIYLYKKQEAIAGFSLYLRQGQTCYGKLVGFDYTKLEPNDFAYFNLAYNVPIREAIETEMKRMDFGAGTYTVKLRRGCWLEPKYGFFKFAPSLPHDTLVSYIALYHQNNERHWSALQEIERSSASKGR